MVVIAAAGGGIHRGSDGTQFAKNNYDDYNKKQQ